MIIDAHTHLWDKLDGRLGTATVRPVADGRISIGRSIVQGMPTWFTDCRSTAELALAAFDEAGVDRAVVTQEYLDGNQNKYLAAVKKKYPDRFFVHGLLDFRRPETLKKDFNKLIGQGFKGVKCPAMFFPEISIKLDAPALMDIWEAMEANEMVLSIDLAAGDAQVPEMRAVASRFKKLKIAVGHFGMVGHGKWIEQIRLAKFENVFVESGGIIWLFRREGYPFKGAQKAIKQAMNAVGHEKLMWGSDYPRTMVDFTYRQSLDFIRNDCAFMSDDQKECFLGKNAARAYGFKYSKSGREPAKRITEL